MNSGHSPPLVSVVIPAFNAEATLRATLDSVFLQTYPHIEIVVVDDGSTDGTEAIIAEYSAAHANLRSLRIANSGVAAARNAGIAVSRGEYIAPLDADDLWHPRRVAEHVAALERAGIATAVAYSPSVVIDEHDRIIRRSPRYRRSGDVLAYHLEHNLVGNGSGITARRDAVLEVGGYPSFLRERGVEGCEDFYLQLRIAHEYEFVSVPEFLVGYRKTPISMTAQGTRMLRSRLLALQTLADLPKVRGSFSYFLAVNNMAGMLTMWVAYTEGVAAAFREMRRQGSVVKGFTRFAFFTGQFIVKWMWRRLVRGVLGKARTNPWRGLPFSEWVRLVDQVDGSAPITRQARTA